MLRDRGLLLYEQAQIAWRHMLCRSTVSGVTSCCLLTLSQLPSQLQLHQGACHRWQLRRLYYLTAALTTAHACLRFKYGSARLLWQQKVGKDLYVPFCDLRWGQSS